MKNDWSESDRQLFRDICRYSLIGGLRNIDNDKKNDNDYNDNGYNDNYNYNNNNKKV